MRDGLVVLVAENDHRENELMTRALEKAAISDTIHSVNDGQSAIDYLSGAGRYADRTLHPLPHFAFINDKLPIKSGLDVLQWVRQQPRLERLPVMILSADADESEKKRALSLGANAHVVKSTAPGELAAELKKFYVFWWPIASSVKAKAGNNRIIRKME